MSDEIEFSSLYTKGKVRRLNNFCCQFEKDKVYEAMISDTYTHVKWDDGSWSSGHFAPYSSDNPSFEIVEELNNNQEEYSPNAGQGGLE